MASNHRVDSAKRGTKLHPKDCMDFSRAMQNIGDYSGKVPWSTLPVEPVTETGDVVTDVDVAVLPT